MQGFRVKFALQSPILLGVVLFLFASAFPPFDDVAEVDLALHMLQHVLLVLAGVAVAYPLFKRRSPAPRKWAGWASLVAASVLIVYWHLPVPWDAAVLDPAVHALEHISFFGVGALIGTWIQQLSDSAKIGALMAAFFGHMGYAFALIVPWTGQVYEFYSVVDQTIAGWALLFTGPLLIVGVAYLVAKNPGWLGGFSGKGSPGARRDTFVDSLRVPRWTTPALTCLLVAVTLVYFGFVGVTLAAGRGPSAAVSTVQISETPVSWQYAPQRITVILGVNSTVTWRSSSISYDSVTSRNGTFDSGPIPPGGSYTFAFSAPGTYEYYCIYHPWMTGKVVVLPARAS